MLSNTMSFSTIFNNNYLRISHHCGQLHINDVTIDMPFDICSLSISKNKIYVVYSHIRHDGFYVIDSDIPLNNIEAYDFSGDCVWNIASIWKASTLISKQMSSGVHFSKVEWYDGDTYLKYFPHYSSYNKIGKGDFIVFRDHEYLVGYTVMGECYTVDLTANEILHITNV